RRRGAPRRRVPGARRGRALRFEGRGAGVRRPVRGARAVGRCRRRRGDRPRRPLGALAGAGMSMHDDDHHHPAPLAPVERRAKALEELLTEKGILQPGFVDSIVTAYEKDIGPMNGARVVARAWVAPAYRARLLADGTAAIAELGFGGPEGEHLVVV